MVIPIPQKLNKEKRERDRIGDDDEREGVCEGRNCDWRAHVL